MKFPRIICLLSVLFLDSKFIFAEANPIDDTYYDTDDYPTESDQHFDDYELEAVDDSYKCPREERLINFSYLCDDFPDCNDGSDEDPDVCAAYRPKNMETSTPAIVSPPLVQTLDEDYYYDYEGCPEDMYQCPSLELCIPLRSLCDGIGDCPDAEDELYCGENTTEITTESTGISVENDTEELLHEPTEIASKVANPYTTSSIAMTSATIENNLEKDVTSEQSTVTYADEFHSSITNVRKSEEVATTETSTSTEGSSTCHPVDEFECRTRPGDCVPRILLCDGYDDCADGTDEEDCGCAPNEYRCISGLCISAIFRCDGFNDCGDHSDEVIGCPFVPILGEHRTVQDELSNPTTSPTQSPAPTHALPTKQSVSAENDGQTASALRECQRNICRNGGTCLLRNNKEFLCYCPKGFSGSSCQINDKCLLDQDCPNSGNQLNKQTSFRTLLFSCLLILILQYFFT